MLAVLFDMNGVLVNDEALHEAAFRAVLGKHAVNLDHDSYLAHFAGRTDRDGYVSILGLPQVNAIGLDTLLRQKGDEYEKLAARRLDIFPGARELVEVLSTSDYRLALVTSSSRRETKIVLSALGVREKFEVCVCSEDVTNGKPAGEPYLRAAEQLGVLPADCLVVEDSPAGVASGQSAGMRVLGVLTTHSRDAMSKAQLLVSDISNVDPKLIDDSFRIEMY